MTPEQFIETTATRIPTVAEMLGLCDSLGIKFSIIDGIPHLNCTADNTEEGKVLAKLFKREPFRSVVIENRIKTLPTYTEPKEICTVCNRLIFDTTGYDNIFVCDKGGAKPHVKDGITIHNGVPRCPYKTNGN